MKLSLCNITATIASELSPFIDHKKLFKVVKFIGHTEGHIEYKAGLIKDMFTK